MTDFTRIEMRLDHPVATLTLNRPEQLNAMDMAMLQELREAAAALDADRSVRAVVVRGEGRAFCAGADLSLIAALGAGAAEPRQQADLGRRMADAVEGIRAITVAALHGWCVGGGLVLAAACDLRLAAEGTRFSIPEVDLGIPLGWGGIPRLVREIGPARTKELVMTCRVFDAHEAQAAGFLTRILAPTEVDTAARDLAMQIAAKPRIAIESTKLHVDAVTAQAFGLGRSWSDADGLLAAVADPEAQAVRSAYLAARADGRAVEPGTAGR